MEDTRKIGFIGAGNMAFAICSGIVSEGIVKAENVWASAPTITNLQKIKDLGCHVTHCNDDIVKKCDVILLCVKPFKAHEVLFALKVKKLYHAGHLVISVMSGVKIGKLEQYFPGGTRIIRSLPNVPMQVRTGVLAYAINSHATDNDESFVQHLFSNISLCRRVTENQLDAVCGLSGSGPAFVYTAIQALADGGVKMGLPRNLATELAAQTVMGAGKMVLETGKHPDALRDEVCSPAGTTICGVHALEKAGVRSAFMDAVEAATLRSVEQGHLSEKS